VCLYVCVCVCVCVCVYGSVCLSICLSVYLSVCESECMFVYVCICWNKCGSERVCESEQAIAFGKESQTTRTRAQERESVKGQACVCVGEIAQVRQRPQERQRQTEY